MIQLISLMSCNYSRIAAVHPANQHTLRSKNLKLISNNKSGPGRVYGVLFSGSRTERTAREEISPISQKQMKPPVWVDPRGKSQV